MSKYKTGDRVKIKDLSKVPDSYCLTNYSLPKNRIVVLGEPAWGCAWIWGEFFIHECLIDHIVTRDTKYIDKRFERMDKLGAEIKESLDAAEMLLDESVPF